MTILLNQNQIGLAEDAIIWRYMDIDKYISFIEKNALFFCRADKFSDKHEGSIPAKEVEYRIQETRNSAALFRKPFDEESAMKSSDGFKTVHQEIKKSTAINCWHINKNESDAMWKLYMKCNRGVAVQSSAKRILKTIDETKEEIEMSKIRYIDYENDAWYHPVDFPYRNYSFTTAFRHKRIEFIHEQEFRLFHHIESVINIDEYWDLQENKNGKFIEINLVTLVDKIWLPPKVDKKTKAKIIDVTKDRGFDFQFVDSKLQNDPLF